MSEQKSTLPNSLNEDMRDESTLSDDEAKQQAEQDLKKLRDIINSQAISEQNRLRKEQSRDDVGEVITEALSDRQAQDESVSRFLGPIVEQSVQNSIVNHRQQFIDYLYPLVGGLVRKFAATFLRDFIEKTNEVIENSVSLKGISWRYKAWRSGMEFPKYVASQTYVYNIQQVLLIHRETGILLNAVSNDAFADDNSDIVSSMLTAINDFVNDSFKNQNSTEQTSRNLDEIKTDDFTLYLKQGPHAFLVAAVTGNISPVAKEKLQKTLEYIHSIYSKQLREFDGDCSHFDPVSNELGECLLSEQISEKKKKKPWIAILLFSCILLAIAYWLFLKWQTDQVLQKLTELPNSHGILVSSAKITGLNEIEATVLRDPSSISIQEWLSKANINNEWLSINEQAFISIEKPVIENKIQHLVNKYSRLNYAKEANTISGQISGGDKLLFLDSLDKIPGIFSFMPKLELQQDTDTIAQVSVAEQAMVIVAGEISRLQINFALASSDILASEQHKLALIVKKLALLKEYADSQNQIVKLLILGTSDNIGNRSVNQQLSLERARNVSLALQKSGVSKEDLMTSGLGIIEDATTGTNIRKAIVNVVYNSKNQ